MNTNDGFRLVTAENGVVYLRADNISCPHGFATRLGGVSTLPHTSSLNLAFGRGDEDAVVLRNLELFSAAVGVRPESVISLHQTHSTDVLVVGKCDGGAGYYDRREDGFAADGYVTDDPGVTLGVKTADCVPILFEDPVKNIVGAVHAGWRGTAAGIAGVCVQKMVSLGASPENIRAAIGPAICFDCYEVGDDFIDAVAAMTGPEMAERFVRKKGERFHADLPGMDRRILTDRGLKPDNISVCRLCTMEHPELFFSHRYSHGKRGTMLSVISPAPM